MSNQGNINTMEKPSVSVSAIDDVSRTISKSVKLISKQVFILNSSLKKNVSFIEDHSDEIQQTLIGTMEDVQKIQQSLLDLGKDIMNSSDKEMIECNISEIEEETPKFVTITLREYVFLNSVFSEYNNIINSSKNYSLFSSDYINKEGEFDLNHAWSEERNRKQIEDTS